MDMQAFYTGHAFDAYEFFGAHTYFGGTHFAVWAPAAQYVQVVGEFGEYGMHRTYAGVWEADVNGADAGMAYQYRVIGANGRCVDHCDPYGFAMKLRPDGRSIIAERPTGFADEAWLAARSKNYDKPLNIYEVHMGSWQQKEDGSRYTYAELAELLPAYCKKYGYTHLELMPLAEYPFDGSWGYQTTGFFAPTSRYGTPDELAQFINACHKQGIGVILDFVPVHFAVDEYGLKEFDGTPLYEYPAASVGQSEWGSCNFMHSRGEIRCFIQSCADYWLRVFHADGLRMDAVSRLIYWQGDPNRGVNGSTLEFLKGMNAGLQQRHPTAILIAEDSTNFPKVTAPVEYGGLGFDYKWDLGWMNDTLDYFKKTPEEREHNLSKLTFSMMYAWNEHYILPFSHDENVHGKATIVQKMYGEYEGKFPQARAVPVYGDPPRQKAGLYGQRVCPAARMGRKPRAGLVGAEIPQPRQLPGVPQGTERGVPAKRWLLAAGVRPRRLPLAGLRPPRKERLRHLAAGERGRRAGGVQLRRYRTDRLRADAAPKGQADPAAGHRLDDLRRQHNQACQGQSPARRRQADAEPAALQRCAVRAYIIR